MELTQVIKAPVLTEKTYGQMNDGVYTFKVDYHANKYQIANAIEFIFKVDVVRVNTIKVEKKAKNVGRFHGFTNRYKKAIVKVAPGQEIRLFPEEKVQSEESKEQAASKAKAKEAESKIAAKLAAKKQKATKASTTLAKTTTHRKVGGGE